MRETKTLQLNDSFSYKVIILSLLTLAIMLILAISEALYFKNIVDNRKII